MSPAVELANDTPYGLSASVWGKDIARATEVAKGIESGAVHINSLVGQPECPKIRCSVNKD